MYGYLPASVPNDRRARGGEELRHLLRVQVVAHREVLLRPEAVEDREDLVLLDELAGRLHRLCRVVRVVDDRVDDLPAVHPTARVDVLEVRVRAARHRGVRRRSARQRRGRAEEDRRRGHARVGRRAGRAGQGGGHAGGECQNERRQRERDSPGHRAVLLEVGIAADRSRALSALCEGSEPRRETCDAHREHEHERDQDDAGDDGRRAR